MHLSDRYRDLVPISAGRSTCVFRGHDCILDRDVALKCPTDAVGLQPEIRSMYAREAKFLAALDHPGIVSLYDYHETDRGPVLVLRCGTPTVVAMRRVEPAHRPLAVATLAKHIGAALDYCGSNGIAHRDVKPSNLIINSLGNANLIDFSIAARFNDNKKWTDIVGTPNYLPPEAFLSKMNDKLSLAADDMRQLDQFSFGVTLYELLSGSLPFDPMAQSKRPEWEQCTAYRLIRDEEPIPISERDAGIPSATDSVIRQMLSLNPSRRFATCSQAAEALGAALSGHLVGRSRVFVSFAHSDMDFVIPFIAGLEENGFIVWWDHEIVHGMDWEDQIEDAMHSSDLMVVVLGANSARSSEVKTEWRYWLNFLHKPLLTVLLEDCRIPYRLFPLQHFRADGQPPKAVAKEVTNIASRLIAAAQVGRSSSHLPERSSAPASATVPPAPFMGTVRDDATRLIDIETKELAIEEKRIESELPETVIMRPERLVR